MPGRKNVAADRLSRQLQTESDDIDKMYKQDINDFVDAELGALLIVLIQTDELEDNIVAENVLEDGYLDDSQKIVQYLTTLQRLDRIGKTEFRAFKKRAL